MRRQLEQRLNQLKAEFEAGQKLLAELEAKEASARETLQRLGEGIQVLEKKLAKAGQPTSGANPPNANRGKAEAARRVPKTSRILRP